MNQDAFISHMKLIHDFLIKSKNTRIILLHNDYTTIQQKTIDSVCSRTYQIVGQVVHTNAEEIVDEIARLIIANHEPFASRDQIKYIIIGKSKLKNSETDQLHV